MLLCAAVAAIAMRYCFRFGLIHIQDYPKRACFLPVLHQYEAIIHSNLIWFALLSFPAPPFLSYLYAPCSLLPRLSTCSGYLTITITVLAPQPWLLRRFPNSPDHCVLLSIRTRTLIIMILIMTMTTTVENTIHANNNNNNNSHRCVTCSATTIIPTQHSRRRTMTNSISTSRRCSWAKRAKR